MKLMILLVGMVLIVEGLPYAAAPESMREWLARLSQLSAKTLRGLGIAAMISGFLICWIVQKTPLFN